jgi:hypothetical protein
MVMQAPLADVGDEPQQFAGCCLAISKPLLQALASALPGELAVADAPRSIELVWRRSAFGGLRILASGACD